MIDRLRDAARRGWVRLGNIFKAHLTPGSLGLAVSIGVFIGSLPIYGLHLPVCILIARWLRLNQAVLYASANISNPLFAPLLVSLQISLGEWLRYGKSAPEVELEGSLWEMAQSAPDLFVSCLIGSVMFGVVVGPALGLLAWGWGTRRERRKQAKEAELAAEKKLAEEIAWEKEQGLAVEPVEPTE